MLYVLAVFFISVFVIALCWYVAHSILLVVRPLGVSTAERMGANSTSFYAADEILGHIDNSLIIVALISAGLWVFVYSQRRGAPA